MQPLDDAQLAELAALSGFTVEEVKEQRAQQARQFARVSGYQFGDYPWDRWQKQAHAAGLPEELADLGRAVMREAAQHGWDEDLAAECGWHDEGVQMLAHALAHPMQAQERWDHLLETDGERFASRDDWDA